MRATTDDRFEATGDEAGTAPGDRKFRPDVQGLRAVAILLVIFYHASIPGFGGGYVGVDVFFVISGFVITGVLLRERSSTGRTSILAFYGRRARRILPAATLVIIVTVVAAWFILGSARGHKTAVDGQWAALFLANFHFAASATNYLASRGLPSPLQNYWSLAVEEQFYIVYPTLFLVLAGLTTRVSLRTRLSILLGAVVVGSFTYSILLTSTNAASAYFSPLTRAWELALGGLVAIWSDRLRQLPGPVAAGLSWLGLAGIVAAAVGYSSATSYPGSLVAVPVVGAALVIGGGSVQSGSGAEWLLRLRPFQFVGLISYSFYLWHWPILVIAAEYYGKASLSVGDNVLLLLVALAAAVGTYHLVENPVRRSQFLVTRSYATGAMACCLVLSSLAVTNFGIGNAKQGPTQTIGATPEGSICQTPTPSQVDSVRSVYPSGQPTADPGRVIDQNRMVVVGDSTSCTLLPGLLAVGPEYGVRVFNGTLIGCGIVSGEMAPYYYDTVNVMAYTKYCQVDANRAEDAAIKQGKPSIILWGSTDEKASIVENTAKGNVVLINGTPQWVAVMRRRIETRVRQFVATGAKVILLLEPPAYDSGNPSGPTPTDLAYERMNKMLREVAIRNPGHVGVVNLAARLCPSGPPCPLVVDGIWVRGDGLHYRAASSVWVARWLIPQILAAAKKLS